MLRIWNSRLDLLGAAFKPINEHDRSDDRAPPTLGTIDRLHNRTTLGDDIVDDDNSGAGYRGVLHQLLRTVFFGLTELSLRAKRSNLAE